MELQKPEVPTQVTWKLKHYRQRMNWDCGLSCVLMCLKDEERHEITKDIRKLCSEEGFGHSTWTIDLCYMIKNRMPHISFYYTTVTLGVDPGYGSEKFYSSILSKDNERINQRFKASEQNGIVVQKRSVSLSDLVNHVATNGVCIVLTNANLLSCDVCENNSCFGRRCRYTGNVAKTLSCCMKPPYQGHYVVMCGYNLNLKQIIYRNPGHSDRECVTSFEIFDDARTSYGTDEDVLFVDLDVTCQIIGT